VRIACGAIFQNSTKYIDRFVAQFYSLVAYCPEHTFEPVLIEGDSTDQEATWNKLNLAFPSKVSKRTHGGRVYGSVDDLQRWRQVSYAMDGVLERIRPEHDALLYVESDLVWEPRALARMLEWLSSVRAIVPMIMMGNQFYDTWSFRKGGTHFTNQAPYHACLRSPSPTNGLVPIDSGGACWAVRGEIARNCRYRPPELSIVGFWQEARKLGHQLWLDPRLAVFHPRPGA
jgi:hypothetical protein